MKDITKTLLSLLLITALLTTLTACGSSSAPNKSSAGSSASEKASNTVSIVGGFQGSIDAWPSYYAVSSGLQSDYGINLDMQFFDSGMPMAQTIPTHELSILCNGSVPCLMAAMRYDAPIISIATNESSDNAVVARPGNDVFTVKSENGSYGTADQVRGKTFLVTTISSGHYAMSKYLESIGLTEDDVTIKNIEPAQSITSFESGDGDFLVLWAPFLYRAYEKGWQKVADGAQVGAATYLLYQADPDFIKQDPDTLANFLRMTNVGVKRYQSEGDALVPEVIDFFTNFAAMEVSENDAKLDIETHQVYTLEEQLDEFESGRLGKDLSSATEFFVAQGSFTKEEGQSLIDKGCKLDSSILKLAISKDT